ncbi:orotate phosphoribosyltransferase [Bacteroidota bacterium]
MTNIEKKIAKELLQIKAIKLEPAKPFTWASGWKSPIYCDNRKSLSFPKTRDMIKNELANIVSSEFPDTDVIAGVATGAIAQGALVADKLNKAFIYIRSGSKKHGLENLIEGHFSTGQKVVVIEDLVSTGGSSLIAVEALRKAGCIVLGMVSVFTYGFPLAEKNFKKAGCRLISLTNYEALIELSIESGLIKNEDLAILKAWRQNPEIWNS